MSEKAFNIDEFMQNDEVSPAMPKESQVSETDETAPELDVQKAVVEELAADKAKLDEDLASKNDILVQKEQEIAALKASLEELKGRVSELGIQLAAEQAKKVVIDDQERNPNALALLDRDVELPDRFPGETRDHVLEVIKEARDRAEADGRLRRAQILESVLIANEPNGSLAKMRSELEKLFADNANLINGPVLGELAKRGIPHKNGEEYLLPAEIIKRTY